MKTEEMLAKVPYHFLIIVLVIGQHRGIMLLVMPQSDGENGNIR